MKRRLLDQVRDATRVRHMSYRTEQAYVHWIKRFIFFHEKRHPNEMDETHIITEKGRAHNLCLSRPILFAPLNSSFRHLFEFTIYKN